MHTVPLSPETRRRLDALFTGDERSKAEKLLVEKCGNQLPFLEKLNMYQLERFRFTALKLSEGNFSKLEAEVELANRDWRDLLMAAGFGDDIKAHEGWFPEFPGKMRYATRAAIDSLSQRFGLLNELWMQDWEWQVGDAKRLPEFLQALKEDRLTDDERFTLSETVMQSFEDLAAQSKEARETSDWADFVRLLRARPDLHAQTVFYWSCFGSSLDDAFYISRLVRPLWPQFEAAIRS